jgi:hypothetical protein
MLSFLQLLRRHEEILLEDSMLLCSLSSDQVEVHLGSNHNMPSDSQLKVVTEKVQPEEVKKKTDVFQLVY